MEPLWYERLCEITESIPDMKVADLTNRKTHDALHKNKTYRELVAEFSLERKKLIAKLGSLNETDLDRSSKHPRLGTPMKVIDLAFFVAEHDDHHLAQMTWLLGEG
jgi:uncharacterized damage-inducible protein DinB